MRSSVITNPGLPSIALLAALAGCSDGVPHEDSFVPRVVPVYEPSSSDIPVPNDLLFSGTADLTLNIPVLDPGDDSDPPVAMNTQDGWSVGAPFSVSFSGAIDVATAVPGSSVRVFSVSTDTTQAPVGGVITGVLGELSPTRYTTALSGWDSTGSTMEIRPLRPLSPSTTYMVVLTDGITDLNGARITTDAEYTIASSMPLLPPDHPMFQLQVMVLSMEGAAEAAGVERDSIAVAYHFTTQSVGATLGTISTVVSGGAAGEQAIINALCASGFIDCSSGTSPEIGAASLSALTNTGMDTSALGGTGGADLYVAGLTLPYFLTAASNATASGPSYDPAPLQEPWASRYPFIGDTDTHLTRYNPLPHPTGTEQIPVLISVPNVGGKPPLGWPVTIFVHGFTANRLSLAGVADRLAAAKRVVVAIDLPLHGLGAADPFFSGYLDGTTRERTFGLDLMDETTGAAGPDGVIDSSGAHMINLANLAVARDNLRQGVSDVLHLNSILGDLDIDGDLSGDLNTASVNFVGHSLGAMVGIAFLNHTPTPIPSTLGMPAGGISKMLDASASFGPPLRAGLASVGVLAGTEDFESFLWASQTLLDTVDPIQHMAAVTARSTPVHLIEVVGGGSSGVTDAVVPNSVAGAPLSGTEPLIAVGGLVDWTRALVDLNGGILGFSGGPPLQGAVRFIEGTHSSLVSPGATVDELAAYIEMGSETATFAWDLGSSITFPDTTVIQ